MRQGRDKEEGKEERERNEGKEGEGDKEGTMNRLGQNSCIFTCDKLLVLLELVDGLLRDGEWPARALRVGRDLPAQL